MTDQELFDKLKREGECWCVHDGTIGSVIAYGREHTLGNPGFSTPDGFFWLWERAQEKEWWDDMIWHSSYFIAFIEVIHPTRFTEVLKEYLSGE